MSKLAWLTASLIIGGCCINPAYGGGTGGSDAPAGAEAAGDAGAAGGAATGATAPAAADGSDWEARLEAAATLDKGQEPIDQLKSIPERIQAQIDIVMQPITDADAIVTQIQTMPARLGITPGELKAAAKASLETGSVQVNINVAGDALTEVQVLLDTIKGIGVGLKEMPKRAQVAVTNVVKLGAQATALTTKVKAKAAVGFGKKAEINKANAAEADQIVNQVQTQITTAKATIMGLPGRATSTLAKLAASFSM
jgi:hypothetical protein